MSDRLRMTFLAGWLALSSCRANDDAAWKQAVLADRARTEVEMKTSPTSPLAAVERHILPTSGPTYARVQDDALRLVDQPGDDVAAVFRPGAANQWSWEPARAGITATLREGSEPVAPGPLTRPSLIRLGRFTLLALPVEDTFVVTVYDAMAEPLRRFTGLSFFAPDRRFAVTARLERLNDPATVTLPTTIGLKKTFVRHARLRFELDGKPCELIAYRPVGAAKALVVPFRDATSGDSTYGAGRYLDLEEPAGDSLLVDFNRAYSPMCSYSPAFNCPIPPRENHLTVAVAAGEKTYH